MKIIHNIEILFLLFMLSACGGGKNHGKPVPVVNLSANGHYIVETFVLDGNCVDFDPIEIVVWENNIYDDRTDPTIDITGHVDGKSFTGIITFDNSEQVVFEAELINNKSLSGDWYRTDETCHGYLTGSRKNE